MTCESFLQTAYPFENSVSSQCFFNNMLHVRKPGFRILIFLLHHVPMIILMRHNMNLRKRSLCNMASWLLTPRNIIHYTHHESAELFRARIFKRLWSPGIDSKEISPAYVAWAGIFKKSMGARNKVGIGLSCRPARRNSFLGIDSWAPWIRALAGRYNNPIPPRFLAPVDCLKIPALCSAQTQSTVLTELVTLHTCAQHHSEMLRFTS